MLTGGQHHETTSHRYCCLARLLRGRFAVLTVGCSRLRSAPEPKTEEQKTVYALGLMLGRNIGVFNLTPRSGAGQAGLSDFDHQEETAVEVDTYGPKLDALARSRSAAAATAEKGAQGRDRQRGARAGRG